MTKKTPYEFQMEDIQKIARQRNGLLGHEMGCGKTLIAIEIDKLWYEQAKVKAPTLVIAPINTFDSWVEKYSEQSPESDVIVIDRKNRGKFLDAIKLKLGDVYLMHWDALRLMPELQKVHFNTIIGDEVHRIANRKAQVTRAVKKLDADHLLGLSGTASGDRAENLWSICNWLWPSYFRSYWKFVGRYCVQELVETDESAYRKFVGVQNVAELQQLMRPWYVRHLKRERCCPHHPFGVMDYLPDKSYETIWVDLNPTQRRVYKEMKNEMIAWLDEHKDSPALVAANAGVKMARLSQIALATPFFDEQGRVRLTEPSSKIEAARELILDHPDKSFVVFSSSKQACYLAQKMFERAKISCEVLSGDTPQNQRDGMVGRFQAHKYQVFIGVIAAAAEGIDGLQHVCDTAIFLDRSWSAVKNKQAEDRLDRGGQKNATTIIDIMAKNTLDFGRWTKLEVKWQNIRKMLGDGAQEEVMRGTL